MRSLYVVYLYFYALKRLARLMCIMAALALPAALLNLWDNSFEHGAPGAGGRDAVRVTLSSGRQAALGQSYLEVADNGGGITGEMRERVFEPFFTTAHRGTGLGLYLAREMCEYNQARLLLLQSDQGVRFRLVFAA